MATSITSNAAAMSDGQKKHYARLVQDAATASAELALNRIPLDREAMQRVLACGDELKCAIASAVMAKTSHLAAVGVDVVHACEIMRSNCLTPNAAQYHLGVNFSQSQLRDLEHVPYTQATLEKCRYSHVLVAGSPMTVLGVYARLREKDLKGILHLGHVTRHDHRPQPFIAEERVHPRWYLLRNDLVPSSTCLTFVEQAQILPHQEEIPRACEFVYAVVLYRLVTGRWLFPDHYARCSDVDVHDRRVAAGFCRARGLVFYDHWHGEADSLVGLASIRKPDY